jgi:hypothetical protein
MSECLSAERVSARIADRAKDPASRQSAQSHFLAGVCHARIPGVHDIQNQHERAAAERKQFKSSLRALVALVDAGLATCGRPYR